MAGTVRVERGADGEPSGAGTHPGEENPSLPLRPPRAAAGTYRRNRRHCVAGRDPLGLITFSGAFGKEADSAVNAASEGYMSYEEASATQ